MTVMIPVNIQVKILIHQKLRRTTLTVRCRKIRESKFVEKYGFQFVNVKRY